MAERDGERPKKSWREIDARRDRSSGGSSGSGRAGAGAAAGRSTGERTSRQYRAALEALFDKGGVGKLAEKLGVPAASGPARTTAPTPAADGDKAALRTKVLDAIGRDAVTRAVEKYRKEHPLPEDWEFLEQVLEHRDDDRVREALALLSAMLDRDRPRRTRVMAAKLRFIEETSDDARLRAETAKLRARIDRLT